MGSSDGLSHRHHYVPEWYQKFFTTDGILVCLDLKYPYSRRNEPHCYPKTSSARCFYERDLYQIKFGNYETDVIERRLFGNIDDKGKRAVENILNPQGPDDFVAPQYYQDLSIYMDAQIGRTPRGLKRFDNFRHDKNLMLSTMAAWQEAHISMWFDGVWEIFTAAPDLEFIFSDNPVVFYNRGVYPGSKIAQSIAGVPFDWVGTQTIFPLSKKKLLVITHTQFARNPGYNPKKQRINPRYFEEAVFNAMDVMNNRTLSREDTLKVNFIIKSLADRYVAASDEALLYPERQLKFTHWGKIAKNEFLIPDPKKLMLSTGVIARFEDGSVYSQNEYGLNMDDAFCEKIRAREAEILHERQRVRKG